MFQSGVLEGTVVVEKQCMAVGGVACLGTTEPGWNKSCAPAVSYSPRPPINTSFPLNRGSHHGGTPTFLVIFIVTWCGGKVSTPSLNSTGWHEVGGKQQGDLVHLRSVLCTCSGHTLQLQDHSSLVMSQSVTGAPHACCVVLHHPC